MILQGDALEELRKLPDKCCSVCVTSPPYYNARDYGAADQLGTESSPEEYTRKLVEAFREVARVLKDDGTLWLNIGDSYARHIEDGGIKRKDLITGREQTGRHGSGSILRKWNHRSRSPQRRAELYRDRD